ncbi:MAG: Poly-beta-1,6-N-acetyl-D-glucosamine synthase [candidate division BRC1 bacterium ADurb.BinA364]|nr:MAG: Poly-beta-1,6-N-acetyl-D-glucosamine synthase [candidate division BRC1 bacterium ADurb.BinA364]
MFPSPPDISIVIPAFNAAAWIGDCLDSVRRQRYPSSRIQTLVIDNRSADATSAVALAHGFEVVSCARPGPAAARNEGIRRAKGTLIAFLDSDAIADSNWLAELCAPFADSGVAGVGGRIEPLRVQTGSEYHAFLCGILDQQKLLRGEPPFMLPFAATVNAAYRADALREAGGFDEAFFTGEDADLAWRIQWAGGRLAYAPNALVRHRHRATRLDYLRQIRQYGEGTAQLFAKHRGRLGRRAWIAWGHIGVTIKALALAPIMLAAGRDRAARAMPFYDAATGLCWTAGRIAGSLKHRVWTI